MRPSPDTTRRVATWVMALTLAVAAPLAAGFVFARLFAPTLHSRYFPWLTGRALGIAAYLSLSLLVALGIWMRHPWRLRQPLVHAETRLRLHAVLGSATLVLVAGHVVSLASDKYAGVGWWGAFIPLRATYRPVAISLGVVAMLYMVVVFVTARLAGRIGSRHWLWFHRVAGVNFLLVWFHGVLAGTDTSALRTLYVLSGAAIVALAATRYGARRRAHPRPRREMARARVMS